ncbi:MAG TPA: ArgR family transcriptional regulator [Terriglobales bacterium]|nr:ArgR family transcriptional regulator [Terriglobales bacterium]
MSKPLRQRAILELLERGPIPSQEDLQRILNRRGFDVGQATLSRDVRDLGLIKTSEGYTVAQGDNSAEAVLPPVSRLVREFVLSTKTAQNLLVIKTSIGSAQPVAAALDGEDWQEAIGTIAGDDTILMVCPDKKAAKRLESRIQGMLG